MKEKIIGIFVCMLLIATAVPALGTTPNLKISDEKSVYSSHEIEVEWELLHGGVNEDLFRDIKQTDDGGYIAVGVWDGTWSLPRSGSHWLVKFDANGDEEWNVSVLHNATHWPRCYVVEQTSDGGFVTAGSHESGTWGYNRCIWKVDADGNTDWLNFYDDPLYGYHTCIQQTDDGGYIVTGEVDIDPADWDVLLFKTDSTGNVEWQKIFRYGDLGDNAYAVRQTSDGGYILSGRTESSVTDADLLVIKTDSNGDIEWDKTYGGNAWDWTQSNDILLASDGGYYFLGETNSFGGGSRDIWLIKTDADGNEEWNKTYDGKKWDMCGGMDFTDDGGIIITATLDAQGFSPPMSEGLVIKTDENGVLEWQQAFGDVNVDQLQSVCSTSDGGYIVSGGRSDPETGFFDGWLIKMKGFENNPPDKPDKPSGKKKITPGAVYTYKTSTSDPEGDQVYYCWDWNDSDVPEIEWLGPYNSTEICEAEHYWEEDGDYIITVLAKDSYGRVSEVSDGLRVTTPKSKAFNFNFPILNRLFERFANVFPILRYMMGL
jgi:hypothetical protein